MGVSFGVDLPLALFSTLVPMGAGAFLTLCVAFFTRSFDEAILKKIDRLTAIPLIIVLIGFICAFFHLASPGNSFGVLNHVGVSPMSNEIVVGIIFCIIAIVYWIIAVATKMSDGLRKGLSVIVAIAGLIFAVFIGLAYGMDTISSWNNAMVPLSTLCFAILGGSAVGMVVLVMAGANEGSASDAKSYASAMMALAVIGAVGSALCFGVQMGMISGLQNNLMTGAELIGANMIWIICAVILLLIAGIMIVMEVRKSMASGYAWLVVIVAFAAILIARLCFYATELSIGLSI